MAKAWNMPSSKMIKTIVGTEPPRNRAKSDTQKQAQQGEEAFIQANGDSIIEAMDYLHKVQPHK